LVGDDLFCRIRTIDSDPDRTVHLGTTRWGTPVNITETVAQADRRICVGNIEYHYFAGYSGGAKALMPGVSDRAAIQANHRRMVEPTARAGAIDDNVLRRDLEEAADICGCDFILNVVLDEHKRIVHAVAGDHRKAHRAGCMRLDRIYKIPIEAPADLVIASPGGYPKDINLYQAQKALDNAAQAVRSDGVILLIAQCKEGYGEPVFSEWIHAARKPEDLIVRIQKQFELGGHKAAAIAGVLDRAHVFLVSDMPDEMVRSVFLRPFTSIDQAIEEALKIVGQRAKIIFMPHAGSTLPAVR
jgi:lactate racemase